jgi:hypothetical protein
MKDNVFDFEKFKNKKIKEQFEEEMKKFKEEEESKNIEMLKEVTGKSMLFLSPEELDVFNEVGVVCRFNVKDTYSMCIVLFRDNLYILNHIGGKFEYIGKLEDVIADGIFGKERR